MEVAGIDPAHMLFIRFQDQSASKETPSHMQEAGRQPEPRGRERFIAVLADRRMPLLAALLSLLLTLPALWVGLISDDLVHRAVILNLPEVRAFFPTPVSMFEFLDGDPERALAMMDRGVLPWWTMVDMKVGFWRPLTVLTHWIDYRLWPTAFPVMHLHSLLWYAALVLVAGCLYRRIAGPTWIAGLAALLYAVDDAHAAPAAWLANRNILLATCFGLLALLAHDRWRRRHSRLAGVAAPVLLLLSLLSAEAGLSTCAYLAAHAVCLDRGRLLRRLAALAPAAVVVIAWRIAWTLTGHSAEVVGFYVDPLHDPAGFLKAVVERVPILLLGQWAPVPSELFLVLRPPISYLHWALAVAVVSVLAGVVWPRCRSSAVGRFWCLGMILALLPICTTFPSDRLLFFVGLGAMGLLAEFLAVVLRAAPVATQPTEAQIAPSHPGHPGQAAGRPRLVRGLAWALVAVHLVFSPTFMVIRSRYPLGPDRLLPERLVQIDVSESVRDKDLCIVNAPLPAFTSHVLLRHQLEGRPAPKRLRVLAPALAPVRVHRSDDRTLVIAPARGFGDHILGRLFRTKDRPMKSGDHVQLQGLSIKVTRVQADGMPAEAVFRFDVPLEDDSLYWLRWKGRRLVPWTPPPVGKTVELEPARWRSKQTPP